MHTCRAQQNELLYISMVTESRRLMRPRFSVQARKSERKLQMAYYYRDYGGPPIGPASETELKELARRGIISPTTEVRSGMSTLWFSAAKIPGIHFTPPPSDDDDLPATSPTSQHS